MGGIQLMTLKNLFVALVVGCALAMSANSASAHLFGHGGSHGSYGGSWGGSYGSGGSYGGSYGGSWGGSYGSSGGSYGGYTVSYGSWGGGSYGSYGGGSCGGYSCGSCGASYSSCSSCGGGCSSCDSGCSSCGDGGYAGTRIISSTVVASAPAVKTSLTLHVPADAKITLAGVDTKQSGDVRQFATTRLAAGQTWDSYKVVVEMNKNGQTLHEERTIKLIGGEAQELSINFDSTNVAKN
jgi:uncharacterized protein (TIGR03000 family)